MIEELYYTSAPRGLKAGSRDYCTVARTQSLSPVLADELEALSAYRILFMPRDPNFALNPVVWSHLRIRSEGQMISVLSRICASGLDYTGRTNKFAHHVAIRDAERPRGGPAWLLSQNKRGFMIEAWDGQVGMLTGGRVPQQGDSTPGIAESWKKATRDAGWAGVLAETFLADPKRLVYVVFQPGMDLLPLFAEAEALLPLEKRWDVGFNTYYTTLPPGVSCPWLGIVADSPEVAEARRLARSLIIDLTQPLEEARGGALVDQARDGKPRAFPSASSQASQKRPAAARNKPAPDFKPAAEPERKGWEEHTQRGREPRPFDLAPAGAGAPPPIPGHVAPPPISLPAGAQRNRRKPILPFALATGVVSLLLIVGGIFLARALLSADPPLEVASKGDSVEEAPDTPRGQRPGQTDPPPSRSPEETAPPPETTRPAQPESPVKQPEGTSEKNPKSKEEQPKQKKVATEVRPILAYKALPKLSTSDPAPPSDLLTLEGEGPWTLALLGLQDDELKEQQLQVEDQTDEKTSQEDGATIQVMFKSRSALEKDAKVARFSIHQQRVLFSWDGNLRGGIPATSAESLRDCVLEVREAGKLRWTVVLRQRHHQEPLDLDPSNQKEWRLDCGSDPPPIRTLNVWKWKPVLKPGAKNVGAEVSIDSVPKGDGSVYRFPLNIPGSQPFELSVMLRSVRNKEIMVNPVFSPSIQDSKKELTPLKVKLDEIKGNLLVLNNSHRDNPLRANIPALDQFQAKLESEIKALDERIKQIEIAKSNYQLIIQIGFKVAGRDFEVFTFGDKEARDQ